jgi:hypothetical protein
MPTPLKSKSSLFVGCFTTMIAAGPLMADDTKTDAIKYDVEHSDPAAKVVIQSNDGVRFRISEWFLRRMMYVASPPIGTSFTSPILLRLFYNRRVLRPLYA